METRTSADGTKIAFDRFGSGPPIVMVVGAFNDRATTEPLARALADRFTIINYDRRGRGASGDTEPYAVEREIEDLDAMLAESGGAAAVFGYSSGAVLALRAAASGAAITRLALYEPPFRTDGSLPALVADLPDRIGQLVALGRRGEAVELYQAEAVGIPPEMIEQLRQAPFRPQLEALAHTLAYDATIIGDLSLPTDLTAPLATPTLVLCGELSSPFMRDAAQAVAAALPGGELRELAGQSHAINPGVTAPPLADFVVGES